MTSDVISRSDSPLDEIQRRILWLSTLQVHYANNVRPKTEPLKVGGHQASCASVVTIMTSLFFRFMRSGDLISIKPHASPVLHAVQYLLGNLDASYLERLRDYGGLQAYPSRTKDPDPVDFSTGSVGLGAVAPNFAALVDLYLRTHQFGMADAHRRFISLVGDAELDEGSVWEAIAEPAMTSAGNVLWIVDLNRQSLDRVIPGIRVRCWREMFAANGWNVIDVKYGRALRNAFDLPNGELLRICIDELSNDAYQRLLRLPPGELREWLPAKSRYKQELTRLLDRWDDAQLHEVFWNLGGHDLDEMDAALAHASGMTGPSVIFAYTLKGWKLPTVGHAQNHSILLNDEQIQTLRHDLGVPEAEQWSRFDSESPAGRLCDEAAARLRPADRQPFVIRESGIPDDVGSMYRGDRSTQQAFGLILSTLSRECPEVVDRIVTVSPDVASSTNLGGWITKHEVWQLREQEELPLDADAGLLKWTESPRGQHIELGISENNLFLMLGALGLSNELFGEPLIPLGTLYDPFIRRGLDAMFYAAYSGAKFIVVGTPSGVTLAGEGGAHQSMLTASIGAEFPELTAYEPCFAQELEWILLDALRRVARRESSTYLRLTTKRVDQELFHCPGDADDRETLRRHVLGGAYRLRDARDESDYSPGKNVVHLFAAGAVVPDALQASDVLKGEGLHVNVFNVTGPGPLYANFQLTSLAETIGESAPASLLDELVSSAERSAPVVTVVDAHPHSLAWIGSALGTRVWPLGVTKFGQSGTMADVYRAHHIDAANIASACRTAIRYYETRPAKGVATPIPDRS